MQKGQKMSAEAKAKLSAKIKDLWANVPTYSPKRDPKLYSEAKNKYWSSLRKTAWDSDTLDEVGLNLKSGIKKCLAEFIGDFCHECKIVEWQGQLLILELHHIDGNHKNNKKANLQLLCPNCHSLKDNHCKNKGKYRK